MDETTKILQLIGDKSKVRIELGTYVGFDNPRLTVDVGGGRIPAETVSAYRPEINEQIQIAFVDGRPYVLGPAIPKPGEGTIISVASNIAQIQTDIGVVAAPYPAGTTLVANDKVKLFWSQGPYVLSKMSTSPPPAIPPLPGGPGTGAIIQQTFTAIQAGSWQSNGSRWIQTPRASNGYLGAWHFGSKIRDTIPANAYNGRVEIYIHYTKKLGVPNFALHDQGEQAGAPTLTNSFAWDVVNGFNRLPAAQEATFFNALKAGGGKFGIGLDHGGQNIFASLGEDPMSGALRITWST